MSAEIIDLGSRRPAVTWGVTLRQGFDGSLSVQVHDTADDERSRLAAADALARAAAAIRASVVAGDPVAAAERALDGFWAAADAWRAADADPSVPVEDAIRAYAEMKAASAEMQAACAAAFEAPGGTDTSRAPLGTDGAEGLDEI